MVGYWDGELSRIASPDHAEPVPFGRVTTDAARLAAIERSRTLTVTKLFDQISVALEVFIGRWSSWSPVARARVGLHPTLGEVTVAAGAERFIIGHLADHAAQLASSLGVTEPAD